MGFLGKNLHAVIRALKKVSRGHYVFFTVSSKNCHFLRFQRHQKIKV